MLTRKQHDLLTHLIQYVETHDIAPSFEELCRATGLKSKSGIHRLMLALEERGYIARLHHRARAVAILRYADGTPYQDEQADKTPPSPPNAPDTPDTSPDSALVEIPLLGKIAAGTPIAALEDHANTLPIPQAMLGRGEYFALTIEGDSMIEAGILDGDVALIERTDTAQSGEIVVALINQEEATLKRLRRKAQSIALEPANPAYKTRIFGFDQIKIQGRLKGLIRQY